MKTELAKFGCRVDVEEKKITVHKCKLKTPQIPLEGHNDHRIVMALSVLATLTGGVIYGAEAVEKSLPDFFERISGLGIKVAISK